ncbi:unnamed protein product [Heligmosomoides polygyrus]|uniref:Reverse transcriptase domain-containing protein n=1 Tax=Heligmosomoides polygyrus TaxID=6339 RepID=A0A183GFM7_HELPZ|nr:unnamed protein product [Heligmosomoides polygyrus]
MPYRIQKPTPWTLLYADDVMLASEEKAELERQVQAWCDRVAAFQLELNFRKSEYLTTDVNETGSIEINGSAFVRATHFKLDLQLRLMVV